MCLVVGKCASYVLFLPFRRGVRGSVDSAEVEVWSFFSFEHVLIIRGRFIKLNEEFYLANVYAPCDDKAKQVLWDLLFVR